MANQFLIKDTMQNMKDLSALEIDGLKGNNPIYAGVELLGYHEKGDTPAPIVYYYIDVQNSPGPGPEDGGSVVTLSLGGKLVHNFGGEVDAKYFGAKGDSIKDDTMSIQTAISYLVKSFKGGICYLSPSFRKDGRYIFSKILVESNIVFQGTGGVLKLKDNHLVDSEETYYLIHNSGHKNVTYAGLIIEGNSSTNTLFKVADIITCTGKNSVVKNCRITDAPDSGIMFSSAPSARCEGNIVEGARDLCIYINGANSTDKTHIANSIVSNNILSQGALGGIGIKRGSGYLTVTNNTIDNCGNGISVEDSGNEVFPEKLLITQNVMRQIGQNYIGSIAALSGIYIAQLINGVICNNMVYDCAGYGIYARNIEQVSIDENIISGNKTSSANPSFGRSGIVLDGRDKGIRHASICNNTITDFADRSLTARGLKHTQVNYNKCIGNPDIHVDSVFGHQGIVIANEANLPSSHNEVIGNTVVNYKSNGLHLNGLSYSVVKDNIIDVSGQSQAYALRMGVNAINNIISSNMLDASDSAHQLNFTAGTISNLLKDNLMAKETGIARYIRRNTSLQTPVGVLTPRYEGEIVLTTAGGLKYWMSTGILSSEWLLISTSNASLTTKGIVNLAVAIPNITQSDLSNTAASDVAGLSTWINSNLVPLVNAIKASQNDELSNQRTSGQQAV
ncbi:right-handed parallel beta-helix repeat-containing protein [Sphingobacterium siyangense]